MDKPSFFQDVYEVAKLIPYGKVTTYGAIATYLGAKGSARMVGWAMNGCPAEVPAHRVVNRIGLLTGKHHFHEPNRMQELLESENITVKDDKIENFDYYFWDPMLALGL
ncbi:MAG: MGMT family protein [Cyclobacteriaceae bacterium]|nr:MGMT family protein [Cyclobacteriaceae bacterium]